MRTFPFRMILKIGAVQRDGTLPFAADAFVTICLAVLGGCHGGELFGIDRPLQASNDNRAPCRNRQGPN